MVDIRGEAAALFNQIPAGTVIESNKGRAFEHWTGWSQVELEKRWNGDYGAALKNMSTCMDFVNTFTDYLRYNVKKPTHPKLGNLQDLKAYLEKLGFGHAWVPSGLNGRTPYPGDVVLHAGRGHIDVVTACTGSSIEFVASGQTRIVDRVDKIKRYGGGFDATKYEGWVDIEIFYGSDAQKAGGVPKWLVGRYWEVTWRSQYYNYFFDKSGRVWWCDPEYADPSFAKPPQTPGGTGRFTYTVHDLDTKINIFWDSGSVETFELDSTWGDSYMSGQWNWCEPISASRIDI